MKTINIISGVAAFLLLYNSLIFSQGDVTLRITEEAVTQSIQTLLDSKGINFHPNEVPGIIDLHISVNTATIDFRQQGLENTFIHVTSTARVNVNLFPVVRFELEFELEGDIEGGTIFSPVGDGYIVMYRPDDLQNFTATGFWPLDNFVADYVNGYAAHLPMISYVSFVPLLPNIVSQYFTSGTPNMLVTNDEVLLWLDVNEGYLAYDNVNYTKNHSYRYLEGGMDYVIQPGGNMTFTHGSNGVNLTDGFTVQEGGIFSTVFDPNLDSEGDNTAVTNMNLAGKNLYVLDTAKPENIGKPKNIPLKYELHQNYPNPFNPSTTIKYDLKNDGKVSLVVYDIIGREVIKLVDWNEEAGYKSVTWDGRNKTGSQISSGVYFYTLRTGDFVKTVKMVFVK